MAALCPRWLAIWVRESEDFGDLNDDGDLGDNVLHMHDLESETTTNLELARWPSCCPGSFASEDSFVFSVYENLQGGEDLNGDGDADDVVLHEYNPNTGTMTNLEVPCANFPVASGNWIGFFASEHCHGEDLNGDGDLRNDFVWHVHDLATGERLASIDFKERYNKGVENIDGLFGSGFVHHH